MGMGTRAYGPTRAGARNGQIMNWGFIYLIKFSDGTLKVGRSKHRPRNRIKLHALDAAKFGISAEDSWVSRVHPFHDVAESVLIKFCKEVGTSVLLTREFFTGVDLASCVRFAEGMVRAQRDMIKSLSPEPIPAGDEPDSVALVIPAPREPVRRTDTAVLEAIRAGYGVPDSISEITGIARSTVNKSLKELHARGRIRRSGLRVSKTRPWAVLAS